MAVFIKFLSVLLRVGFVTLFERKILGFSQNRLGPNKVRVGGFLQPIFDGLKLFSKNLFFLKNSFFWGVLIGPFLIFIVIIFLWIRLSPYWRSFDQFFTAIYIFVFIGLSVYSSLLAGWRSVSKFSSLGAVRSCSQSISYEISFVFYFIIVLVFFSSFIPYLKNLILFYFFILPFLLNCLAETNRAPIDLREGERELISGFNLEFGGSSFGLLFLSEYGMILFFRFLIGSIFMDWFLGNILITFVYLLFRRVYPRLRYDSLIEILWVIFLPLSLILLLWIIVWL